MHPDPRIPFDEAVNVPGCVAWEEYPEVARTVGHWTETITPELERRGLSAGLALLRFPHRSGEDELGIQIDLRREGVPIASDFLPIHGKALRHGSAELVRGLVLRELARFTARVLR